MSLLDEYADIARPEVVEEIRLLARPLENLRVLMVNSARQGGGVAEIMGRLVPLLRELGIESDWKVISGDPAFFRCTKTLHNGLQGKRVGLGDEQREAYENGARRYCDEIDVGGYRVVVVHDPQPAALVRVRGSDQKWIWRCHVDASSPDRSVWRFLHPMLRSYDASIFSMPAFAQNLEHPQYVVHPSIDPLSPKNEALAEPEVSSIVDGLGIPCDLPILLQVSRFDRFKDPVGVIRAFRRVRGNSPSRLVLVGGTADDDPEGEEVLEEVRREAGDDPEIHVLVLPADSHRKINALQRVADIVIQKSTREGFGLTVTEAMYKARPVVGGAVGGINLQVHPGVNGFLVHSIPGAAHRIRYLLHRKEEAAMMGAKGRHLAIRQFLITRHLRDYLLLFHAVLSGEEREVRIHPS